MKTFVAWFSVFLSPLVLPYILSVYLMACLLGVLILVVQVIPNSWWPPFHVMTQCHCNITNTCICLWLSQLLPLDCLTHLSSYSFILTFSLSISSPLPSISTFDVFVHQITTYRIYSLSHNFVSHHSSLGEPNNTFSLCLLKHLWRV